MVYKENALLGSKRVTSEIFMFGWLERLKRSKDGLYPFLDIGMSKIVSSGTQTSSRVNLEIHKKFNPHKLSLSQAKKIGYPSVTCA